MSFQNPRPGGNQVYLKNIKYQGHGSVLEHAVYNFLICNVSRALTHELVRHRHFSFSQLSQRYVDESVAEYVEPPVIADDPELHKLWEEGVNNLHKIYLKIVEVLSKKLEDPLYARKWLGDNPTSTEKRKWVRQNARIVLPNATETKIFVTANARALRNFLELRCNRHADWEIRKLANLMLDILQENSPNLFGDYEKNFLSDGTFEITTLYRKV
jgi:thymidylate synthase (FAD)